MDFIETSIFTRLVTKLLSDDDYCQLQSELIKRPDLGPIIQGSGGVRKLRWARSGKGKSSGYRVIYYWITMEDKLLMLYIYPKNQQDDLTAEQLKILRRLVEGK